jgi:hypothetical protein
MIFMPRSYFVFGRMLAVTLLAAFVFVHSGCGNSPVSSPSVGALSGNWQFNLLKNYPFQQEQLSASGFLQQSNGNLTGSVQGPTTINTNGTATCGGTGPLTGSVNNQTVSFTLNPGGTTINFTGTISPDQKSMSGSYEALGGGCYSYPTSGIWTAFLIPPLNGKFTGTIDSSYMGALAGLGVGASVPLSVSGSFAQGPSAGSSAATLTGTITAAGYPCFTTASLTGTISGQNIYLSVYGYNGLQIGTIGQILASGASTSPATLTVTSTGLVVTGSTSTSGFFIDLGNPCPAVNQLGKSLTTDSGGITLNVQ